MLKLIARAALAVTLALGIAGCADQVSKLKTAYQVVVNTQVPAKAIVIGIQTFDAVEITATEYLSLRRCNGQNAPICRDPQVTQIIKAAILTGRQVRNDLKAFVRANPDGLGPQDAYDRLVAATETIKRAIAAYSAASGS